jgi:hypothetical protein
LKSTTTVAGDDVAGPGAGVDVADLPAGGLEEGVAAVPLDGGQFGQRRRQLVDGVARQLRVGNVALHALDRELAGQVPRRPFLIMSPRRLTEVGSPTMQAVQRSPRALAALAPRRTVPSVTGLLRRW